MHRRTLVALSLVLPAAPALAQAAGRLPPEAPEAAPRAEGGFSAGLLAAMEAGEALARERLGTRFSGLRVIRRQQIMGPGSGHGNPQAFNQLDEFTFWSFA